MLEQTLSLWQRLAGWRLGFRKVRECQLDDSDFWVWLTPAFQLDSDTSLKTSSHSSRWQALVQDISPGGLNLVVQNRVEPGTLLKMVAEGDQSGDTPFLWVRVIHVVPACEDTFVLGCVFPFELTEGDLESFGAQRLQARHPDYRAWVRFPCDARATYKPAPASEPGEWQARIENISPSGIRLIVATPFEPGALLNIALPISSDQMFRTVLACVVHVSDQKDGNWSLGCSFSTELSDDDLLLLGVSRVKSNGEDCRTWVRRPCSLEMFYTPIGDGGEDHWPAKVLNISATGIALKVGRPVEPGALLNIDLKRQDADFSKSLLACVVYVREMADGEWALGCTFTSDLSLEG